MVLDFEYGINTGNRFLDLVDHDEDPDEYIARQTQPEEKTKKSSKDTKAVASASNKKTTTKPTTTTTTSTSNVSNTTKTNKENFTGKSTNMNQRKQQSTILGDNNNQQPRGDSARGSGGRGFSRRGGSAGQDRPPYEGGNRGGGQQRFNKFEGQQTSHETSGFEQAGESWGNEQTNDNNQQPYTGGYRGRGRGGPRRGNFEGSRGNFEGGRGNFEGRRGHFEGGRGHFEGGRGHYEGGRGHFEGGRGGGRGRGGRGRGYYNNRSFEEGSQDQQQRPQTQENNEWQQNADSNIENTRSQTAGQDVDVDASVQDRSFEPDNTRRGGRGHFRSRTFHNNRNYGSDRPNQYEREGGEMSQGEYRHNRHQHDRQPRTNVSGVKPIEKKEGAGAHNWGDTLENPEENPVSDELTEGTAQTAPASKDWSQQVDEAEKLMTLDEYKKQMEAKKQANSEKLPQFNKRSAGEGVDPKDWQKFQHLYRKKNDDEEGGDDEEEEGSAVEENESGEENEEEHVGGKKKVIIIPLRFNPVEIPRGPAGSRGGPRRGGGGGRFSRDQPRPKSPSQQQTPSFQQTGEFQNNEQQQQQYQSRPYRGGSRPGRGEYRRSYGNSARGPRGSYNRSHTDSNTPDFDNAVDFPTLLKQ